MQGGDLCDCRVDAEKNRYHQAEGGVDGVLRFTGGGYLAVVGLGKTGKGPENPIEVEQGNKKQALGKTRSRCLGISIKRSPAPTGNDGHEGKGRYAPDGLTRGGVIEHGNHREECADVMENIKGKDSFGSHASTLLSVHSFINLWK